MRSLICVLLISVFLSIAGCVEQTSNEDRLTSNGVGGSTAQFVVQQDHLIVVEDRRVKIFDLADAFSPSLISNYRVTGIGEIETVFPYKSNRLLFGTTDGVLIVDHSTPGTLEVISSASHVTSCDPVVAKDNYMYVTIRDGRTCTSWIDGEGLNQLMVFDITDDTNPQLVFTLGLDEPWGLSVVGTSLFICYASGLKEFDITNPLEPTEVADYPMQCNDIIATTSPMVMTGDNAIRLVQKDGASLMELSVIQEGD